MQDLLNKQIQEYGIDCWRSDFNMDPLPYWRNNDAPNRQGITESHYVEGFYRLWDSLREKNPRIYLDDCASGGRRIDLETVMRSVVQTRSDTEGGPGRADWDQSQSYGLNLFLPLHASFEWDTKTYDIRSSATAGFLSEWDILNPAFPVAEVRANFAEIKENQKYWYGDYYPLTAWTMAPDHWMAWQFNRPDLGEGIALAFRHAKCPYPSLQVALHALKLDQNYEVTFIDEEHRSTKKMMTGQELSAVELRIEKPRNSLIVRYKAVGK
jgi:alpha-galactosidase